MNLRTFKKHLNQISTGKRPNKMIDVEKIATLSDEVRSGMVHFIVRNRQPVLVKLIPDGFDWGWLRSMGYLNGSKNAAGYEFVHTSEQKIR